MQAVEGNIFLTTAFLWIYHHNRVY